MREQRCQRTGIEPLSRRAGILRVLPHRFRPKRHEPRERVVEPLPDQPLQRLVAAGALGAKCLEVDVPPDDAAREEHRAARPRSLLQHARAEAELAGARGAHEPGHAGACDDYVSENVGLCSTYSTRTRSGPQRNTAYVFGASTTSSISTPRSFAASMCSSAESTRTARWFSSGLSGEPGFPGWNSTHAPPTSTRGAPARPGAEGVKPSEPYASAVASGSCEKSAT